MTERGFKRISTLGHTDEKMVPRSTEYGSLDRRILLKAFAGGTGAAALLAACGNSANSSVASATEPPATFEALVAQAKAAKSHTITGYFDEFPTDTLKYLLSQWNSTYGFEVTAAPLPGDSADLETKMIAAYQSKKAVADFVSGGVVNLTPLWQQGGLRKPDWGPLIQGIPLIDTLRQSMPNVKDDSGKKLSDYCMVAGHTAWPLAYNTKNVSPDELQNLTWDSLTQPQWSHRVVVTDTLSGIYLFPLAPGWDEARMVKWVKDLKANDVTVATGGTTGAIQSILNGEGDIGIASAQYAMQQKLAGAPIDIVAPTDGWIPGSISIAGWPTLTLASPPLSELFTAWYHSTARTLADKHGGGGEFIFPTSKNPVADRLREFNITIDNVVAAQTLQQSTDADKWRNAALAAFTG